MMTATEHLTRVPGNNAELFDFSSDTETAAYHLRTATRALRDALALDERARESQRKLEIIALKQINAAARCCTPSAEFWRELAQVAIEAASGRASLFGSLCALVSRLGEEAGYAVDDPIGPAE